MTARAAAWLVASLACVCGAAIAAPPGATTQRTRSPGKPTAPMTIEFALGAEPAAGALLEISIEVRAPADVRDLALDVRAEDSRALLVAAQAPAAERGAWTATVVPLADGTSYLNVTAQGTIGGETQARAIAIPIRAGVRASAAARPRSAGGTNQAAQAREAARAPGGERVVLLPVVETPGAARK